MKYYFVIKGKSATTDEMDVVRRLRSVGHQVVVQFTRGSEIKGWVNIGLEEKPTLATKQTEEPKQVKRRGRPKKNASS